MWLVAAFALAGGLAQFVDGTLGMGFGVTSATVLLFLGVAPATASAATHAAKLPTTLVSGLSHWREGNIDVLGNVSIPWLPCKDGKLLLHRVQSIAGSDSKDLKAVVRDQRVISWNGDRDG